MLFVFIVPVQTENGRTLWFRGERHALCMAGDSIYEFAGFRLQRDRAVRDSYTRLPRVYCRPLTGERFRWLLIESEFTPCAAPADCRHDSHRF
jgi:hypothetical protein